MNIEIQFVLYIYFNFCLPKFKKCNYQESTGDFPRQLFIKTNKKTKTKRCPTIPAPPSFHSVNLLFYVSNIFE